MKTFRALLGIGICVGILAASATSGLAGIFAIYTLDNTGNAYYTAGDLSPATQATDPVSGLTTLEYTLPFAGTAGDVLFQQNASGPVTDLLRFDGNSHVYFFSTDGVGSPAYVAALPATGSPNAGPFILQNSSATLASQNYNPTSGQPGYNAGTQYSVNVVVPEPSPMVLGAMGCLVLLFFSTRRLVRRA